MERIIKFRVWNEGHEGDGGFTYFDLDDQVQGMGRSVTQFTGLSDKNGLEVYEGDIVRVVHDPESNFANVPTKALPYGGTAEVYYDDVNAGFYLRDGNEETSIGYYAGWGDWNWLEIIGNIHENPELLDQPQQ